MDSVQHRRRRNLLRKLLIPIVFAMMVLALVLLGREWLARHECLSGMRELGQRVRAFEESHGRLPSREQVLEFELHSRLKMKSVNYDETRILPDSQPDTPLAYSSPIKLRYLRGGRAVLECSGTVRWLDEETFQQRLARRERLYNARILDESH